MVQGLKIYLTMFRTHFEYLKEIMEEKEEESGDEITKL